MLGWLPDFSKNRAPRILCLGAHSDDIEIGCGASLLKIADVFPSLEICWVVFSGNPHRSAEATNSADYWLQTAANKKIELHTFKDGFFPDQWGSIKTVFEDLKNEFEPDLIFTHYHKDLHQDHRIINELTWNTFRNHSILEYEIPKYDGDMDSPNFYIPVEADAAVAKASALIRFFGSQQTKHWFCEELFLGLMRIRGIEACSPSGYAEGFYARKTCASF